jgi:hypothetical protein
LHATAVFSLDRRRGECVNETFSDNLSAGRFESPTGDSGRRSRYGGDSLGGTSNYSMQSLGVFDPPLHHIDGGTEADFNTLQGSTSLHADRQRPVEKKQTWST